MGFGLGKLLKANKLWKQAKFSEAVALWKQSRFSEAVAIWESLATAPSPDPEACEKLYGVYRKQYRFSDSLEMINACISSDPSNPKILIKRADVFHRLRQWKCAESDLTAAMQKMDNPKNVLNKLHGVLVNLNEFENTSRLAKRFSLGDEQDSLLYCSRLVAQRACGEAEKVLYELVRKHPDSIAVWTKLAQLAKTLDGERVDQPAAREFANKLKDSNFSNNKITCAKLLLNAGLIRESESALFEIESESIDGKLAYAVHFASRGYLADALHHYTGVLKFDPANRVALENIFSISSIYHRLQVEPECGLHLSQIALKKLTSVLSSGTDFDGRGVNKGKILYVIGTLAPGGAERQIVNLTNGVSRFASGVECKLLYSNVTSKDAGDFYSRLIDDDQLVAYDRELDPDSNIIPDELEYLLNLLPMIWSNRIRSLAALFVQEKPEVVHAYLDVPSICTAFAAAIAGIPQAVGSWRNVTLVTRGVSQYNLEFQKIVRTAFQCLDVLPSFHFSANAKAVAKDYCDWLDIDLKRVSVVYSGINRDSLGVGHGKPSELVRNLEGKKVVGGVFRLHPTKQPMEWVEVARKVQNQIADVLFVVVGTGALYDEMKDYTVQCGIKDSFLFAGLQENVAEWYWAFDVLLSTSKVEGLSNTLMEAHAMGVPVVSYDVGGNREIITEGVTGFVLPKNHTDKMAEKLCWVLENDEWRRKASGKCVESSARFGFKEFILRNLTLYTELTGNHQYKDAMSLKKFIIISQQRSGSHMLMNLLNSHPSIHCNSDLQTNDVREKGFDWTMSEGFKVPDGKDIEYIGFLVKYKQSLHFDLSKVSGIAVIHLSRRNRLTTFLSSKVALKFGCYENPERGVTLANASELRANLEPMKLEPEEMQQFFEKWSKKEEEVDACFRDMNTHRIYYEDICADRDRALNDAVTWLGLDSCAFQVTDGRGREKLDNRPMNKAIANYGEVKKHFKNSPWATYFEY